MVGYTLHTWHHSLTLLLINFVLEIGQTEWSMIGRYTGITEIPLTEAGKNEALTLGDKLFGAGRYIDMSHLVRIFVSPRVRTKETFKLLTKSAPEAKEKSDISEDFSEWNHGEYEGKTTEEIRDLRAKKGLDKSSEWSIWTGGCEGGESVEDMTERVKRARTTIENILRDYLDNEKTGNVMIVGHGTFLRCFWKYWHGLPISHPINLKFETGTIATLSYENRDDRSVVENSDDHAEHNISVLDIQPGSQ
jgi:broad specificity phosphatase PhoE